MAFITTIAGMVIKLASMCYKSKCKEVQMCCVKIVRDTAAEAKEEEFRIEHPENTTPRENSMRM